MKQLKSVKDLDVKGKRVLVRVDYNVPMEKGVVTDDTRVRCSFPTVTHLIQKGAKVILISHLGRPKGRPTPNTAWLRWRNTFPNFKKPVAFAPDCVGPLAEPP
jgi:phosphoglycerate kinase